MIKTIDTIPPDITGNEDVIIVPLFKETKHLTGIAKKLDVLCRSTITDYLNEKTFTPDAGETLLAATRFPKSPRNILLVGLGEKDKIDARSVMSIAGSASRIIKKRNLTTCHLLLDEAIPKMGFAEFLFLFIKGFSLAQYRFSLKAKDKDEKKIEKLILVSRKSKKELTPVISKAQIVVEHIEEARDLVNTPAGDLTPALMAKYARSLSKKYDVHCHTMGHSEIVKKKMGAVLDVCKGSKEHPSVIVMHYNREKRNLPTICLVGKGVTFDSGGISIKPWEHMDEMKGDMAGGAVVISTVAAAARLKLPFQIVGIVPCVENMPSGTALKPGDVVRTYSGKTIEILSTDAEGRLILADALTYATEFKPKVIIDFATLTGACVIALGKHIAGIMGSSQKHIDMLLRAGKQAGEPVWQLPLDDSFKDKIKGEIADYKNYGGRDGSTMTAATLLAEFVGETPWVHIDIAGPFWSDSGHSAYTPKGGTGYGVDLALRFLDGLRPKRKKR